MHLTLVSLPVADVEAWATTWSETLGLPVTRAGPVVRVQVGRNVLELRPSGAALAAAHHLAVTIPTGSFRAARTWLSERASLLDLDGRDEFEGPAGWRSRSLYFDGPGRSVLELIERRDLEAPETAPGAGRPFGPQDLLGLSEVGVAVEDVAATVTRLAADAGVLPYANPASASFAAVGDVHGLLILVAPGRAWLPTSDRLAGPAAVHVEARAAGHRPGARSARHRLGDAAELRLQG